MQGKWVQKPQGDTTVVFVHGILSNGETAWKHKNGSYWPELLKNNPDLTTIGIYVFTYQTAIFSGSYSLSDVVDALKEQLRLDGVMRSNRIIFVCHSMGGIVVRKYVVERATDLIEEGKEIGLFLVASPSLGSHYADLLKGLAQTLGHSQATALGFVRNNEWLSSLDKEFTNLKESRKISIQGKELIEDKFSTHKLFFLLQIFLPQIVEPFSGAKYFGEQLKIPASDHSSIAKPENSESLQHKSLVEFITTQINSQQNPQVYIGSKNDALNEEHLRILQDNLDIKRVGSFSERYSRAIDLLSKRHNDKLDTTSFIAGVASLGQLANESAKDHWPIVEQLVTLARQHIESQMSRPITEQRTTPEIQAIFNVLGRRNIDFDLYSVGDKDHSLNERTIDFSNLVIRGASFRSLSFPRAWFVRTEFHGCDFRGAQLQKAVFQRAKFRQCLLGHYQTENPVDCTGADFMEATFDDNTYLTRAKMCNCVLIATKFGPPPPPYGQLPHPNAPYEVELTEVDFSRSNLSAAQFVSGSAIVKADFEGAILKRTRFMGVDLSEALNITPEQLRVADTNSQTILPRLTS